MNAKNVIHAMNDFSMMYVTNENDDMMSMNVSYVTCANCVICGQHRHQKTK